MPRGRQPAGEHALTDAERQARYCARRQAQQAMPTIRHRRSGDLVLGDDDGVLCVPFDQVEAVFKAATAKYDAEQKQIANIQAGTHDASWVDKQLREMKCEGVE